MPSRNLASQNKPVELHLKSMYVDDLSSSRLKGRVFVRATFAESFQFEFGKDSHTEITRGVSTPLDYKVEINPTWIEEDEMSFKIELVSMEGFKNILVRCNQVALKISEYNRTFQCFIPMQRKAFMTYRLGTPGQKPAPNKVVQVR